MTSLARILLVEDDPEEHLPCKPPWTIRTRSNRSRS